MKCPKCEKSSIYISSDKINSWCRLCNSHFAHFEGKLFYLGTDPALQYAVKQDGSIKKVRRRQEGNTVIIEEERMIELEKEFKNLLQENKRQSELYYKAQDWFFNLPKEKKIELFLSKSELKELEDLKKN